MSKLKSTILLHNLFIFLCTSFIPLFGQIDVLPSEYYSLNDGLSARTITDIIQNKAGFLWLGTPNGLNKFDGYEFTTFNNYPNNPNQINNIDIERIREDKNGNLVITYKNILHYFDLFNPNTYKTIKVDITLENGVKGIVREIYVSPRGEILVLSKNEQSTNLYQLKEDLSFEPLFLISELNESTSSLVKILQLSSGSYLINDSDIGLRLIDSTGLVKRKFAKEDFLTRKEIKDYPSNAYFLHQDGKNRVWITLKQTPGVFLLDTKQDQFRLVSKIPQNLLYTKMWEDKLGGLLFGHSKGVGNYSEFRKLFYLKTDNEIEDLSFLFENETNVISLYSQDFSKSLFLGLNTGFKIVKNIRSQVITFLDRHIGEDKRGAIIKGITGDGSNNIYFSQESDFWYHLDLDTDSIRTISLLDSNQVSIPFSSSSSLALDGDSLLWGISSDYIGNAQLIKYHLLKDTTTTFVKKDHSFNAFCKGKDGRFYIVGSLAKKEGGLIIFDPRTNEFKAFADQNEKNPLKNLAPNYILEDGKGIFWIGTNDGLFQIDLAKKQATNFNDKYGPTKKGLTSTNIFVVHKDMKGMLWLGTTNGLNKFDPNTGTVVETYDKKDGLASNYVCGILSDEKDNLWISTYDGLSFFDRQKDQFRNFYRGDGLSHDEFTPFSFYKAGEGKFLFGGVNGINVFQSSKLLIDEIAPKLQLTKLIKYNINYDSTIVQTTHLDEVKEIKLSPYDSYIQLHFTLPVYNQLSKNRFQAKLEGYENDWTYLGNSPIIRYNSLPSGKYTLRLRGADPNGNWSKDELSVMIDVGQVFYKTWWFLMIIVVIIALASFFIFQYRLEHRLRVERLRMKISSDLHDELSGLLSGIAMQTDVLQLLIKDAISKEKLKKIGEVSRKAMSKMSDVIWSIDSRKDKVDDLIQRMREHAEDILMPINIKYDLIVGKIEPNRKMPVVIRQNLYFIFKEAINNIAKHSTANYVLIRLGNVGSSFEMIIQDNGGGIEKVKATQKTGMGLTNLKMRAQRIDANLKIIREKGYTVHLLMKKFA